jgi:predicted enzyme related to lactoylglutathione lyase
VCLRRSTPFRSLLSLDSTLHSAKERVAMSIPGNNHKINYIEFISTDIAKSKQFYSTVFGWSFVDYGPDYISFQATGSGIDGGFLKGEAQTGSPLIVLYASDLAATEKAILAAGGSITVPTFDFPGGRRFHFADGAGNLLAVWSE